MSWDTCTSRGQQRLTNSHVTHLAPDTIPLKNIPTKRIKPPNGYFRFNTEFQWFGQRFFWVVTHLCVIVKTVIISEDVLLNDV